MKPSGVNDMGSDKGPDLMVAIGGPTRPGQQPDAADMSGEDCVPLSALNLPDESEQMQAPEEGDPVQYTVEGTVTRIEGENAYIKRQAINGQPVEAESDEPENPAEDEGTPAPANSDDQQLAELEDMAGKTQLT